jgi:hypothetical protein
MDRCAKQHRLQNQLKKNTVFELTITKWNVVAKSNKQLQMNMKTTKITMHSKI